MAISPLIDRQLLGDPGLALDDDAYVQVVAGLGASRSTWSSSAFGEQRSIGWCANNFLIRRRELGERPSGESVLRHRAFWADYLQHSTDKRILISPATYEREEPNLISIVKILDHPAVGAEAVIIENRPPHADLRWQWPLRISALPGYVLVPVLLRLGKMWPSSALVEVYRLTRGQARSELLVMQGSVRDALGGVLMFPHALRAAHIFLLGPLDFAWSELASHVDTLLAETQAGALSLLASPASELCERLNQWVTLLSHNVPYDLALAQAFPRGSSLHVQDLTLIDRAALPNVARNLGRKLRQLPATVKFELGEDAPLRLRLPSAMRRQPADLGRALESASGDLPFDRESRGGMGLSEIGVAVRSARREASRVESPRFLQGDLDRLSEDGWVRESRGFVVGDRYRLDVFIGPPGAGALEADAPFPDEQLEWGERDSFTLQVVFAELRQWDEPLSGTLRLPRNGRSSKCRFVFSPTRPGPFAGRVTLYHQGRVLQTARLDAVVLASAAERDTLEPHPPLTLAVEAELRQSLATLDERRRFDACLVLNHTTAGTPAMMAAGKEGAYIASLEGIGPQLSEINRLLSQVALDAGRYGKGLTSKDNAELLCSLAAEGNILYRRLVMDYVDRSSAAESLRRATHLQIVSATPDAIVPLEFVYDYPPPQEGAPVCRNARKALIEGCCPAGCVPDRSPAPHVCPLGFWGLSKVIERHVHDPDLPKPARIETDHGEPIAGRNRLTLEGASLLAASRQVPGASRTRLAKGLQSAWKGGRGGCAQLDGVA